MNERQPQYSEFFSGSKTIPSSQGLSQNTWYMFDYEFAYDNNVTNISKEKSDMIIGTRGMEISNIDISGSQEGEINGNIILNSPTSLFNIPSISIKNTNNDNSNQTNVSFSADPNDGNWWSDLNGAIKNGITKSVSNAASSLSSSVLNLITNPVGNFLNSLIHRGKNNGSSVQLKLATKIELEGTISTQTPVSSINLHIPGSQNNSLEYLYDGTLGVFNLDRRPQLKYQQTWYHIGTSNPRYFQYYELDRNSFNFIINPDILSEVTVLETKSELFFYKKYTGGIRLDGLVGLGDVNMPSDNNQVFGVHSGDLHYEYYKIKESSVKPIAPVGSASYGFMWNQIPSSNYFGVKLDPDKRFVVKTTLKLRINSTGREVTIIKSFLPEYIDDQSTINLEY